MVEYWFWHCKLYERVPDFDLQLVVKGHLYLAHRCILSVRCQYFTDLIQKSGVKNEGMLTLPEDVVSQIRTTNDAISSVNFSWFGLGLWCLMPYFSYILAVSFIGGGNQSTWRKPPTCRKSLYHVMFYRVHLTWGGKSLKINYPVSRVSMVNYIYLLFIIH